MHLWHDLDEAAMSSVPAFRRVSAKFADVKFTWPALRMGTTSPSPAKPEPCMLHVRRSSLTSDAPSDAVVVAAHMFALYIGHDRGLSHFEHPPRSRAGMLHSATSCEMAIPLCCVDFVYIFVCVCCCCYCCCRPCSSCLVSVAATSFLFSDFFCSFSPFFSF